jgi:hypothetical protein
MKRRDCLLLAVCASLLATALLAPLQAMPYGREQALYAVTARGGVEGLANAWAARSPGTIVWARAARGLLGAQEGDARTAEWLWMALGCLLAALTTNELAGGSIVGAALAAMLAAIGVVAGGLEGTLRPGELALSPLMLAFGLWGVGQPPRGIGRALAAGLTLGAAICFAGAAVCALPAIAAAEIGRDGDRRREAAIEVAALAGGALMLPAAVMLWVQLAADPAVGLPGLLSGWFGPVQLPEFSSARPLAPFDALSVAALTLLIAAPRELRLRTGPSAAGLAAVAIGAAIFPAPGGRALAFGLLAVTAGVACAAAAQWIEQRVRRRRAGRLALAVCAIVLIVASPWRSAAEQWSIFRAYLGGEQPFELARRFDNPAAHFSSAQTREAAGALARLSSGGGSLFIWGPDPGLYHYSALPPASLALAAAPWPTGPATDAALQALFLDHPPESVAVRDVAAPPAAALANALAAQYRLAAQSGVYRIYRRADLP